MSANVKPRYQVEKLPGTAIRRIASPKVRLDDKGKPVLNDKGQSILLGGFDYEDKKVDAGWMVYFPNGSSIRVWSEEEMARQGFDLPPDLVDMDNGELKGSTEQVSFKAIGQQKETITKSSKVPQTL